MYFIIHCVASYVFWSPIVTIFRDVFFEGYIAHDVKAVYKYKILSFK